MSPANIKAARSVAAVYSPHRLRLARELRGLSQARLAARLEEDAGHRVMTGAAISQAEKSGGTTPRAENLALIAEVLDFPVGFFALQPGDRDLAAAPFYRHLRRTRAGDRRQADRFVEIVEIVVDALEQHVKLPAWPAIGHPVESEAPIEEVADQIETAALDTRRSLGIEEGPIQQPVTEVERSGAIVVRLGALADSIDAFSDSTGPRPIIVLTENVAWDRDGLNVAHEVGHVVLHRDAQRGTRTVESQAFRFGGAFLAPADQIVDELPTSLDWHRYLELKFEWGLSIAALLRRSRDLEVIDPDTYTRGMKYLSARGWRKSEPGHSHRPLTPPQVLGVAIETAGLSAQDLAERLHLPEAIVTGIVGRGPKPTVSV